MIAPVSMNNEVLAVLIRKSAEEMVEDQPGFWKFKFREHLVLVITDESHNRMRIMAPVAELDSIAKEDYKVLLAANFDRALDARYCSNENMLWSAFIHPLRELGGEQFLDALKQVVTLASNFGTTFASTDIVFGGS